ncbi:cupin domain-containing protein [Sphingomonas koreensis]|nr:cupin domain-containing protein [Sphingomonas koreensis]
MPKLDLDTIPQSNATGYPPPYADAVKGRWYRRLAPAAGLTDFGASHVTLKPGAWSAQRHWHAGEDEFLVMLSGEAVLVDDEGEHVMRSGDCAAFPKNDGNGHHLQNRGDVDCVFVVIGAGENLGGDYPDIDMRFTADDRYVHNDGSTYETTRVR